MTTVVFPFTVAGGRVVTTNDPAREIESKVVFCLSTQVGERVMNPGWGIQIMNASYSMGAKIEVAIDEAIRAAFRNFFPTYQVKAVEVIPNTVNPTYIVVNVRWGKPENNVDVLSKVGVQLPGGGEHFLGEGN